MNRTSKKRTWVEEGPQKKQSEETGALRCSYNNKATEMTEERDLNKATKRKRQKSSPSEC